MKPILLLLLPLLITFLFNQKEILTTQSRKFSCKTTQTKCKSNSRKTVLTGTIYDCETKKSIPLAHYSINDRILSTDSIEYSGSFYNELNPGRYKVTALAIMYKVETRFIKIKSGDSIHINFYLKVDDKPLH